jgi:predicted negative regulator of RcsB-dependent stress response
VVPFIQQRRSLRADRSVQRWPQQILALSAVLLLPLVILASPDTERDRHLYVERLTVARAAYFKVVTSGDEAASQQAHQALDQLDRAFPNDPVAKAYQGSLQLLDVAHSWAVWNLHKQANDGLAKLDQAVAEAPDEPEARFIRAATSWHLPSFYHRKAQSEADFALLASRAERDAREGRLPPELAAAAYSYWGQILVNRSDKAGARTAFESAMRISATSPAGQEAAKRLKGL